MQERGLTFEKGSIEFRRLAHAVIRAELEALRRSAERDAGNFGGNPTDPIVQPPTALARTPGETILELFDRFRKEKRRTSEDTHVQNRKIVVLFDEFVGGNQHVSAFNRKNFREWKNKLSRWPGKAQEIREFKGKSFLEIIEHNETLKKPTISDKTI